jgi:hypothetical protein
MLLKKMKKRLQVVATSCIKKKGIEEKRGLKKQVWKHNLHLLNLDGSGTIDGLEIKCVCLYREGGGFFLSHKQNTKSQT